MRISNSSSELTGVFNMKVPGHVAESDGDRGDGVPGSVDHSCRRDDVFSALLSCWIHRLNSTCSSYTGTISLMFFPQRVLTVDSALKTSVRTWRSRLYIINLNVFLHMWNLIKRLIVKRERRVRLSWGRARKTPVMDDRRTVSLFTTAHLRNSLCEGDVFTQFTLFVFKKCFS